MVTVKGRETLGQPQVAGHAGVLFVLGLVPQRKRNLRVGVQTGALLCGFSRPASLGLWGSEHFTGAV